MKSSLGIKAAFFLAVVLTIAVRLPHLNRPLSEHNEFEIAQSLIALENLDERGFFSHYGSILQTYPGKCNRYVKNPVMRLMDARGNWYYTSFPPFSIILPYLGFHATGRAVSVLALQVFNIFLHAVAAWFILRTILWVLDPIPTARWAALAGATVFLFLPPDLWYFSNVYSWDTFWLVPWIVALWALIRAFREAEAREGNIRPATQRLLGATTFFLVYSEYHGLLFVLSVVAYVLVKSRTDERIPRGLILILGAGAATALLLTIWQYASICGLGALLARQIREFLGYSIFSWSNLIDRMSRTFLNYRSLSPSGFAADAGQILHHYIDGFDVAVLALAPAAVALLAFQPKSARPHFTRVECLSLYLALFPVIIHNVLLFHWSAVHDTSVLKASVFISFLVAILLSKVLQICRFPSIRTTAALAGIAVALCASVYAYETRFVTGGHAKYLQAGLSVRGSVTDDDVVFAVSPGLIVPQIVYYAKRNIQSVQTTEEAQTWLQEHSRTQGIVLFLDDEYRIQRAVRISASSTGALPPR